MLVRAIELPERETVAHDFNSAAGRPLL
jgi:hypothetical protein